ncbi:hypothetical protein LTR84_008718 [Exophiala bonariae]|uniref:ER-bound oxygenase mpaB/mpaB'/Rubber oxygenase catalytic domain-containing protein n=1 Tax=Exophiala bonariae TaxID=1690606 RepID=A0AAV9MZ57_9EURO|nr:hypothetical protein LTR84_008718 [Exophiala bonariae]
MTMSLPELFSFIALVSVGFTLAFGKLLPASKSTKVWSTFYPTVLLSYLYNSDAFKAASASARKYTRDEPANAVLIAFAILAPLKYIQRKLRFARINATKWKYGYTDGPASWEHMTIKEAQEIEANMAETSTDPGVSRAIGNPGHFINEDRMIEHERMQATIHLMTGMVAHKVKSRNHSLIIARINEHHHRYGMKINSDDVLYLMILFGLAPIPWINRFGYRKLEPFEEHAIWTLWREVACRMGIKYIPRTLEQAKEWRRQFERTLRWREDANEVMASAMLDQVLYPIPGPLKGFVAQVFVSIVDWDKLEQLAPNSYIREIVFDIFRVCGWLIREFGFLRISAYQRSPPEANRYVKMTLPHTPVSGTSGVRERFFAASAVSQFLAANIEVEGVAFEAMGAPHRHPDVQSVIEKRVRENASVLENAEYGYRPAVRFQANRSLPPVKGPSYGSDENAFAPDTPLTPNNPTRFSREYERRGGPFVALRAIEKPEDVSIGFTKQPLE